MNPLVRAGLGLALALAMLAIAVHAQSVYVTPPHCWWYVHVNATYTVLYNYGGEPYTIYLMTPSEFSLLYHYEGTYALGSWVLQPQSSIAIRIPSIGDYIIIALDSTSCPSEPSVYGVSGHGAPIGVSSFGQESTSEVLGYFNITAMSAYNPVGESQFNVPNSGASLQLNVVLEIQLADGTTQYYWLQNTIGFVTSSNEYSFEDGVWNATSWPGMLNPSDIEGLGSVGPTPHGYSYGYTYLPPNQQYSLPLAGYLLIKLVGTNPLTISFCYVIIQSGSQYYPPSFNCYDNVTINTPQPVASAAIVTRPGITPSYNAIDAELVFGGYAYGEYTTFTSMNTYLALMYWSNGKWVPYGGLFMNGWDTMESATDLVSTALPNGFVYVTTGELPSNGSSTFLASTVPTPSLPMTYVSVYDTASNKSWSGYVTKPVTYTFPRVIINGTTEYVLTNITVNGEAQSSNMVTIMPSNDFASYYVTANYGAYYLVSVSSPVPITVSTYNETATTTEFTEWVPSGSIVSIGVPSTYTFNNGTRLVYTGTNESITVNGPISLVINQFIRQYLVSVSSPVPVIITTPSGVFNTASLTTWVNEGSVVGIAVPRIYNLGNGTRLVYLGSNETETVNSPLTVSIPASEFMRQYFITITSQYPISINGTKTTHFTEWASPGTTLTIAPTTIFINGAFMTEPGYSITVNGPISMAVQWSVNWLLTAALYAAVALVVVAVVATALRGRRW